jgi:pyruvate dehydrogenase (quinone)
MAKDQRLVADLVVERLLAWGVQRVFGHSGDGINTVLGAMGRAENRPTFVQAVCVLHNQDLAEVTWEQREMEGDPRFAPSQRLPAFPYAGYAELLGLRGIRVDDPADVGGAWDAALAADRPVVLEAVVDAEVPLLPPFPAGEQKLEQMEQGLAQDGPDGERARRLLREQARQERELG